MMRNSVFAKGFVILIALLVVLSFLNAQTETATLDYFNTVIGALNTVKHEIAVQRDSINQYFTLRVKLETLLAENEEDKRDNVFDALGGQDSAIAALGKAILDEMDGVQLMEEMDHVNKSIEEFIKKEIDKKIYQRTADSSTLTMRGYNQLFDLLQSTYENLSPQDRSDVNDIYFDTTSSDVFDLKKSSLHKPVPDPGTLFLTKCGGCWGYYPDTDTKKGEDYHKEPCEGCKEGYYTCNDKDVEEHSVRYCGLKIILSKKVFGIHPTGGTNVSLGICGAPYRNCDNPRKTQFHRYRESWRYNSRYSTGYPGWYLQNVYPNIGNFLYHGKGTIKPPAVSLYGPNGVGFSFDKTPQCDGCMDGSRSCPKAPSTHPKEAPDSPESFKLRRGAARGSIELTWTKSDFDGHSPIKDYEYKMDWKSGKSYVSWCDWTSAGKDMYELITGLNSNARYRVAMRAKNKANKTSMGWQWRYINVK